MWDYLLPCDLLFERALYDLFSKSTNDEQIAFIKEIYTRARKPRIFNA